MSVSRRQFVLVPAALLAARTGPVTAVRVPHAGIQPQALFRDGLLHLVYYTGDPRAGELAYVHSTDGVRWSPPLSVNRRGSAIAAGTIRGAQIALGAGGRLHVAWNSSAKGILYTRLDGGRFEPERNLMQASHGLDGGGSVAADDAGNVYVTWHGNAIGEPLEESRRQVWVATSRDHGKTFAPESPAWQKPVGACACCGMKAFASRQGLRILYRSALEILHRDIYLLEPAARSGKLLHPWEIKACPMSSMDMIEGAAAWETAGQIWWAQDNGAPTSAPGEGKGRKHPRLAANDRGETLLVWTEGTGWQRGGSLAWQLYSKAGKPLSAGTQAGVPAWSFASPAALRDGTFVILY